MIYLLCFYVSTPFLEEVKNALFCVGAGEYGTFKNCSWETLGKGQYQADHQLVRQEEYKVEMICKESCLELAILKLKQVHPCKDPLFFLTQVDVPGFEGGCFEFEA